ncbi:sigma-70 family RNA polymerase sigma factor [soil metagenome]
MDQPVDKSDRLSALMRLAQGGDRGAYDRLLRECAEISRRVLKRRFPYLPKLDAEDLVQEILLSLHTVRATFDGNRPFLPWLMAILRNRTADMARRHARRSAQEVAVDEYPETFEAAEANTQDDGYRDPEALRQAMQDLPQGQRVAIELLKLREMSLKEASQTSGISVGALKVATHRATRALRVALFAKGNRGH